MSKKHVGVVTRVSTRANCCCDDGVVNGKKMKFFSSRRGRKVSDSHGRQQNYVAAGSPDVLLYNDSFENRIDLSLTPRNDYCSRAGVIVTCKKCGGITCHFFDFSHDWRVIPQTGWRRHVGMFWDDTKGDESKTWSNILQINVRVPGSDRGEIRVDCPEKVRSLIETECHHFIDTPFFAGDAMCGFWAAYFNSESFQDFLKRFVVWQSGLLCRYHKLSIFRLRRIINLEKRLDILAQASGGAARILYRMKDSEARNSGSSANPAKSNPTRSENAKAARVLLEKALASADYPKIEYSRS